MPDDRRILAAAFLLAALLAFVGLSSESISLHDEARVAGIGRSMLDTGDWVSPFLKDPALSDPFLEKPPLYWWVQTVAYRVFGVTDGAARAPSGLFDFLTLLIAFALGTHLGGRRCGLVTMLVLATFAGYFDLMHRCLVDPALVFSVALAALGFLWWRDPRSDRQRWAGAVIWGVAIPLSWFAKGVAGPAFTVGAPVLHLLFARRFRLLARAWPVALIAAAAGAATIGPYLLALNAAVGPEAVKELVFGQTFTRLVRQEAGQASHAKPFWFYLFAAPGRLIPWLVVLPALLKSRILRGSEASGRRAMAGFFFFGLFLLSVATDKRGIYVIPILPALAAPIGYWFATLGKEGPDRDWDRPTALIGLGVLSVLPALVAAALLVLKLVPIEVRNYDLAEMAKVVTAPLLVVAGIAGAAGTVWLLRGLRRFARSGDMPGPMWLLAPMAVLLLFFQVAVRPIQDRADSGRPLMAAVAKIVPADEGHLIVLGGSETMTGLLYFDLGRRVRAAYGEPRLLEHLREGTGRFVLTEDSDYEKLSPELRAALELRYREPHRKKHPWSLYEWTGP